MSQLKKGATVRFTARKQSGTGKIINARESERGPWYVVQHADGKVINLRAAQMTPT